MRKERNYKYRAAKLLFAKTGIKSLLGNPGRRSEGNRGNWV
jgi:hypothetical protein